MRSRRENFFLILSLGILNALTPFTIDMYLPSFPEIARDLHVSVQQVALSVSVYFIGYALGQIFYGPLLDRFGRKPPLYAGLCIYILATLGCMVSQTLESLLVFRFLSALGGCVASVGAVAMVRDYFPASQATKVFSMLMLVLSASPLLAPGIGSYVITFASWRTLFAILAGFAVFDLVLVTVALPKGYVANPNVELKLGPIFRNFRSILRERQFATYTFTGSFSFAGLFVYIAGSPSIFMDGFKVSAQVYGGIFALLAVAMIGGGQVNLLLLKRFGEQSIVRAAVAAQVVSGALFLTGASLDVLGLWSTVGCLFLILLCAGLIYPNAAALALRPFTQNVGSASALLGFLQLGTGALASAGVGLLQAKGSFPTALVICVSSLLAATVLTLSTRRQ